MTELYTRRREVLMAAHEAGEAGDAFREALLELYVDREADESRWYWAPVWTCFSSSLILVSPGPYQTTFTAEPEGASAAYLVSLAGGLLALAASLVTRVPPRVPSHGSQQDDLERDLA